MVLCESHLLTVVDESLGEAVPELTDSTEEDMSDFMTSD